MRHGSFCEHSHLYLIDACEILCTVQGCTVCLPQPCSKAFEELILVESKVV